MVLSDNRTPSVKSFDLDGVFLADISRGGDGPGEYRQPTGLAYNEERDELVVRDLTRHRLLLYDAEGRYLRQIEMPRADASPERFILVGNRRACFDFPVYSNGEFTKLALIGLDLDTGEIDTLSTIPWREVAQFLRRNSLPLPYGPASSQIVGPSGLMVRGNSGDYRFEILRPDGHRIAVSVEWTPIGLKEAEWTWWDRAIETMLGDDASAWRRTGPGIPHTKPAFWSIHIGEDDRIWVVRMGEGVRVSDCARGFDDRRAVWRDRCWIDRWFVDVFKGDGTYLGRFDVPDGYRYFTIQWANGNDVMALTETSAGASVAVVGSVTP